MERVAGLKLEEEESSAATSSLKSMLSSDERSGAAEEFSAVPVQRELAVEEVGHGPARLGILRAGNADLPVSRETS